LSRQPVAIQASTSVQTLASSRIEKRGTLASTPIAIGKLHHKAIADGRRAQSLCR
jgi:hypothetical protein